MKRLTLLRARMGYYNHRLRVRLAAFRQQFQNIEERNALHLYGDIAWFGIVNGIVGSFTAVFAIRLGASDTLVGLLSSLPALINILWQIPAARLVQRSANIHSTTVRSLLIVRITYLLIAIMPFVLVRYRPEAVVALITLSTLPGAVANVAFTTLFADAVSAEKRPRVVSVRNALLSVTTMLSVLVAGKVLDLILFPINYQIFFAVAFVASMLSLYEVWQVRPLRDRHPTAPSHSPRERLSLKARWRQTWQRLTSERQFFNFTLGNFIYDWGIQFPMALYNIYRVRYLGATDTWVGLLSMVMSAAQTVAFIFWARVMKRRGNRWVFLVGVFGLSFYPLLTGLSTRLEPLLLVNILGGIVGAAHSVGHFDCFMATAPSDQLPIYLAAYNVLANTAAFVGPLLGTTVAGWIGVRYALILGGILRLIGAVVMSRLSFGSPPPSPALGMPLKTRKERKAG